jgi:uncharacterized membrane protein (DUF2068 family)
MPGPLPTSKTPATLRLIIAYKFARAALALTACAVVVVFAMSGRSERLHEIASGIRHHVTSAWSVRLADVLVRAVVPRHLWILAAALALDGLFTFVEGLSLQRGWWWGAWLVVVATLTFVPFEVIAVVRRVAWGRVSLLAINIAVAVYLAQRAVRKIRLERAVMSAERQSSVRPSVPPA